ncbi:hypothetical protein D9M68_844020 [compost metagenome]
MRLLLTGNAAVIDAHIASAVDTRDHAVKQVREAVALPAFDDPASAMALCDVKVFFRDDSRIVVRNGVGNLLHAVTDFQDRYKCAVGRMVIQNASDCRLVPAGTLLSIGRRLEAIEFLGDGHLTTAVFRHLEDFSDRIGVVVQFVVSDAALVFILADPSGNVRCELRFALKGEGSAFLDG